MIDIYQITRKVSIFTISKRIMYHVLAAVSRNVATRWSDFVMAKGHNIPES